MSVAIFLISAVLFLAIPACVLLLVRDWCKRRGPSLIKVKIRDLNKIQKSILSFGLVAMLGILLYGVSPSSICNVYGCRPKIKTPLLIAYEFSVGVTTLVIAALFSEKKEDD